MEHQIHLLVILLVSLSLMAKEIPKNSVAYKIYQNECGAKTENLVYWNKGENFPSLGIGHFIWYPKDVNERFDESFPKLLMFMKNNHVTLPSWLHTYSHAPWKDKTDMLEDPKTQELKQFLQNTMEIQAKFMAKRLKESLPKIISNLPTTQKQHIITNYNNVANTKNGNYILIDYVNFKGEGIKKSERYKNQGWGLLQVLSCMKKDQTPDIEFIQCAKKLLKQRVQNAPRQRGEQRWIKGWFNRLNSYIPRR